MNYKPQELSEEDVGSLANLSISELFEDIKISSDCGLKFLFVLF